jgi:hypothetical protein
MSKLIEVKITPKKLREIADDFEEHERLCAGNKNLKPDRACYAGYEIDGIKVYLVWYPGQPEPE